MAGDSPFYSAMVEVVPTAKGFERSLNKQLAGPSGSAGTAAGGAAGVGFVGGFGKAIPILGGVLAAAGLGDIIGKAIDDGATYQQAQGAVEDVFGRLGADAIQAFADGGAKSVGQSMNDILSSASLIGIFGKAAGLADDGLVDFSENLITLGADLSAFANTTPEEAVEALTAGLRGESEPLRKYGVLLDDATLKARAMSMGIYDGNGPLTQQQRILAAYQEILAQTGTQQGKFAEESDTLAGRQATLGASWENLSTKMGTAFLPIAEDIVGMVETDLLPALEEFVAWLGSPEGKDAIENFSGAVREIGNFARDAAKAFMDTYGLISGVVGLFNGLSFEEFTNKMLELPGFWGMVFRAARDTATGVWNGIQTMISAVRLFADEVGRNIGNAVSVIGSIPGRIQQAVGNAGSWLYNAGRQVIEGFVNGITSMVGRIQRAITDTVGGAIEWAKDLLGIASPSKVFQQIGEYTSQGFARGIASEYGMVRAATAGMAGAAVVGVGDTYVQNPWGPEFMVAQTAAVADSRIGQYDARSRQRDNAGRRKVQ